jgi:hypothetical protein
MFDEETHQKRPGKTSLATLAEFCYRAVAAVPDPSPVKLTVGADVKPEWPTIEVPAAEDGADPEGQKLAAPGQMIAGDSR